MQLRIVIKMSWFLLVLLFSFVLGTSSEAGNNGKHPSAIVVGTVYCDTCFHQDFAKRSHFISGASVAIECNDKSSKTRFYREVKTDRHGEFKVDLPFSIGKHVRKIKRCSVKLVSSSEPNCAVASAATKSDLSLKFRKKGTPIFSAGFFTFKPENQPDICNEKPRRVQAQPSSREFYFRKSFAPPAPDLTFPPPLQDPETPDFPPSNGFLPPLPALPTLPKLPPLPPLPALPHLPLTPGIPAMDKSYDNSKSAPGFDENKDLPEFSFPPLLPPPILPPNPVTPNLPPDPITTPPAPVIPLPPIPGLTPPPSLPVPLPPFQPSPGSPGIPPATPSSSP